MICQAGRSKAGLSPGAPTGCGPRGQRLPWVPEGAARRIVAHAVAPSRALGCVRTALNLWGHIFRV
jgi:hypothetical protein